MISTNHDTENRVNIYKQFMKNSGQVNLFIFSIPDHYKNRESVSMRDENDERIKCQMLLLGEKIDNFYPQIATGQSVRTETFLRLSSVQSP